MVERSDVRWLALRDDILARSVLQMMASEDAPRSRVSEAERISARLEFAERVADAAYPRVSSSEPIVMIIGHGPRPGARDLRIRMGKVQVLFDAVRPLVRQGLRTASPGSMALLREAYEQAVAVDD